MLLINSSLLADPSEKYLPYTDHCSYFASELSFVDDDEPCFADVHDEKTTSPAMADFHVSFSTSVLPSVPLSQLPQMHLLSSFPAELHTLPSRPRFLPGAFELAPHTKHASPYTLAAILPSRSGPGLGFLQASSGFLLHV